MFEVKYLCFKDGRGERGGDWGTVLLNTIGY